MGESCAEQRCVAVVNAVEPAALTDGSFWKREANTDERQG